MPEIHEAIEIEAAPEAVFDLIARVEDFSLYTGLISSIRPIAAATYRWTVRVDGITLDWDATITDYDRPRRFGWRSVRGIDNRGMYRLQATTTGTKVSFSMEYRLATPLLEKVIAPLAGPLIQKVGAEILSAVKERLESGASRRPHPPANRR